MAVHAGACCRDTGCRRRTRLTLGSMRGAVGKVLGHRLRRAGGVTATRPRQTGARHGHQCDGHGPGTQGSRPRWSRPPDGMAPALQGRGSFLAAHGRSVWHCAGRRRHAAGSCPGCARLQARPAAGITTNEKLQGLRFDARCIRAASWTVPKRLQRSARSAAAQCGGWICHRSRPGGRVEKLPIGLPLVAGQMGSPGVRGLLALLWFRNGFRAGLTDALVMHGGAGIGQISRHRRKASISGVSLQYHRGCAGRLREVRVLQSGLIRTSFGDEK